MTIMTALALRSAVFMLALYPVAACAQYVDRKANAVSGGVTLQEFVTRHERKRMADDTDGDGKISRAEFLAAAKAGKGDPAKRFAKIDRNGDGMLDKAEIDAMLTRRFQRLDANNDGVASADERAAADPRKGKAGDDRTGS